MRELDTKSALVVLSGGQDTTTCLAWAKTIFEKVYAVTFKYGQRHEIEVEAARDVANLAQVEKHFVLDISRMFGTVVNSTLTEQSGELGMDTVNRHDDELLASNVPLRNVYFGLIAASIAYEHKIKGIVLGVCQTDYKYFPDCRPEFWKAFQDAIRVAGQGEFSFHIPLAGITKAETVELIAKLGKLEWLKYSHSCYENKRYEQCGVCDACVARAKGFKEAGIEDPLCM